MPTGIIDGHSHYMPPEVAENTAFFKVNWSDIDRQLKTMDANGIEKSLLLYPTSDAHLNMGGWTSVAAAFNKGVSAVVKAHPGRFIGAGIVSVDDSLQMKQDLGIVKDLGLKVISLASSYEGCYLDDERFAPVFEYAQTHQMPIHVHPQIMAPIGEERVKDPLLTPVIEYVMDVTMCIGKMMMEGTFTKHPDCAFIFAHFGGVLPFIKERFDNTYQMLRGRNFVKDLEKLPSEFFKNCYFDTSGSKSVAQLLCALEIVSPSRIIYGTDYPANQNIGNSISVVKKCGLSDEESLSILKNDLLGRL